MNDVAGDPCTALPWDSEHFGRRVARVGPGVLDEARATRIERQTKEQGLDCVYLLVASEDAVTPGVAEAHGFRLVDLRVTLDASIDALATGSKVSAVRLARPSDADALAAIARVSHTDSRFYFDGNFPKERCDALYDAWIRNSLSGAFADAVLVADAASGAAAGYVTCKARDGVGEIGLIAVGESARGGGLGGELVLGAIAWCRAAGVTRMTVVTQGRNTAAQRLYQRAGFVTRSVELWFHRWST
jgi:ribosomal protein S18 acetylase RimI-like enzyme